MLCQADFKFESELSEVAVKQELFRHLKMLGAIYIKQGLSGLPIIGSTPILSTLPCLSNLTLLCSLDNPLVQMHCVHVIIHQMS